MNNFELFDKIVGDYGGKNEPTIVTELDEDYIHKGDYITTSYGFNDIDRTNIRAIARKTIEPDVDGLNFSDAIISTSNDIYMKVVNGVIRRGNPRRAIVFACVFEAYKQSGNPQSPQNLIRVFGITNKLANYGFRMVGVGIGPTTSESIKPDILIGDIMDKFLTTIDQKHQVITLYKSLENRSHKLNAVTTKSLVISVIWYWIRLNNINISMDDYISVVNITPNTIKRILVEIKLLHD